MKQYRSGYISSNGQPVNGVQVCSNKRDAIKRARGLRDCLPQGSGGEAFAETMPASNDEQAVTLYSWIEHCEGGFRAV